MIVGEEIQRLKIGPKFRASGRHRFGAFTQTLGEAPPSPGTVTLFQLRCKGRMSDVSGRNVRRRNRPPPAKPVKADEEEKKYHNHTSLLLRQS
jgi:hypothetical protein